MRVVELLAKLIPLIAELGDMEIKYGEPYDDGQEMPITRVDEMVETSGVDKGENYILLS